MHQPSSGGSPAAHLPVPCGGSIAPGDDAPVVIGHLLGGLRRAWGENLDGMLQDLDPEFLHDGRVAVRRARTLLSELGSVLPARSTAVLRRELTWLGGPTGRARDLDVFLQSMLASREDLPAALATDLDPLVVFLEGRRLAAHQELAKALSSRRHRQLLERWQRFAETLARPRRGRGPLRPTAHAAASRQLWTLFRRAIAAGRELGPEAAPEALHRLRLRLKKLRYMLELFRWLYTPAEVERLVISLKALQDHLGKLNDLAVQSVFLERTAHDMAAAGKVPVATMLAIGRLLERWHGQALQERRRFLRAFARFDSKRNRACARGLFKHLWYEIPETRGEQAAQTPAG